MLNYYGGEYMFRNKIIIFCSCFAICLLSSCSWITITDSNDVSNTETTSSPKSKTTIEPSATQHNASQKGTQPTKEPKNSDLELIAKPNHPVLFSSTNSAHEFWGDKKGILGWKDREDKKISYPDTTSNSSGSGVNWDACILELSNDMNFGPCNNDYIFGIHICLDNFEKSANLKLNEALDLTSSYLPYDTLKSYYKFNYSTSYKAKNEDCYYDISYSPKKENCQDFILNNHAYSFPDIHITIREDGERYTTDIWINLYQSICNSGRNSIAFSNDYKKNKWTYDFLIE